MHQSKWENLAKPVIEADSSVCRLSDFEANKDKGNLLSPRAKGNVRATPLGSFKVPLLRSQKPFQR